MRRSVHWLRCCRWLLLLLLLLLLHLLHVLLRLLRWSPAVLWRLGIALLLLLLCLRL